MIKKEFIKILIEYFDASHTTLFEVSKNTRPEDLTQIQYNIVEYLYFNEGKSLSALADCMYLSMPNASREVRKLTEKGMLRKVDDEKDKRKHYIYLSEKGRIIMETTLGKITSNLETKLANLSEDDQDVLTGYMKELMDKLF